MHGHLRIVSQSGSSESTIVVSVGHTTVQTAPGSHCSLLIPEPLVGNGRQVFGSHEGDASGDFSARNESVKIGELFGVT